MVNYVEFIIQKTVDHEICRMIRVSSLNGFDEPTRAEADYNPVIWRVKGSQ